MTEQHSVADNSHHHGRNQFQTIDHLKDKVTLITNNWNKNYANKLNGKGPKSVKSMNVGTSFLVAPIYQNQPHILENTMKVK
jgi:hypothetical protein